MYRKMVRGSVFFGTKQANPNHKTKKSATCLWHDSRFSECLQHCIMKILDSNYLFVNVIVLLIPYSQFLNGSQKITRGTLDTTNRDR